MKKLVNSVIIVLMVAVLSLGVTTSVYGAEMGEAANQQSSEECRHDNPEGDKPKK